MLQSFDVSLTQMGFSQRGFHMHDCRITNAQLSDKTLTFEFGDGIYIIQDKGVMATGFAKLVFSGLEQTDFSPGYEIQYLRDDRRECVDFETFQKDLDIGTVDIIYETYNEHQAHFEGILTKYPDWKTIQLNVFFKDLKIFYENGKILE